MNRKNLPYEWEREDFKVPMIGETPLMERCFCVYNSFDRKIGKGCYTVIENCPDCKETGFMITGAGKAIISLLKWNNAFESN